LNAVGGYLTYNKSEYRAWLSGVALKDFVTSLPSSYTKNIMAHSMGNVVVGSAFRQGIGGVANYSLLNAAMAAQAYDPARIDIPSRQTPDTDTDPIVQTNFGLSSKFSGITAKITNFYLEDDFATTIWSYNHEFNKPQ
jgi:esterase/lipase superfamily enzyme